MITNWKPDLILMKKAEVSVFAWAGGARFQYTLLKSCWPRRSAFSIMPLSVVKTLTYGLSVSIWLPPISKQLL